MHDYLIRLLDSGLSGADGTSDDADRLAEITAILATADTISALTDDELGALETELREVADRILDGTAAGIDRNDTEALTTIAESLDTLRDEAAVRLEAHEARQAEVDDLMTRIRAEQVEEEVVEEETTTDDGDEEVVEEEVVEEEVGGEAEVEHQPVAVTASITQAPSLPSLSEMAARTSRQRRSTAVQSRSVVGEDRFIRALERGQVQTLDEFSNTMIEKWNDLQGTAPGEGEVRFRLGRIDITGSFPEDRYLRSGDSHTVNDRKIDALVAAATRPESWTDEIVASGGFCAPTPADYDLMQISGAQRPIRDSLPTFAADRGGVRFTPPPNLSQVLTSGAGRSVGLWTNTTDITPGGNTKQCQTVACQASVEVFTQAVYRCLGFGNFGNRAFPEWVSTWTQNAAAAWARVSEQAILDLMSAQCVAVTSTGLYGYVSELLTHIIQLSVGERSRQRMAPDTRVRVLLPAWVPAQMQIDYLRQGNVDTMLRSTAELRAMFATANVNVTFYEDERTGSGQVQGPQAAAELRDLPEIVEWYMFHEGAFQFLDGGTLDLGIVRDSTLNNTNDFRIFAENWEGLAFRGVWAYRGRSNLCPDGKRQQSGATLIDPCAAS